MREREKERARERESRYLKVGAVTWNASSEGDDPIGTDAVLYWSGSVGVVETVLFQLGAQMAAQTS